MRILRSEGQGYIYWRLLSTDPVAAKEVVLAEKPLISEETDLLEPTLLDELICNISTLASVYHKPPSSFVEGRTAARRFTLPARAEPSPGAETEEAAPASQPVAAPVVAAVAAEAAHAPPQPTTDSLLGDLLMDMAPAQTAPPPVQPAATGGGVMDLLGEDLSGLQLGGGPGPAQPVGPMGGLGDLFSLSGGPGIPGGMYSAPKQMWLTAAKGKGLEVLGTFCRRQGQIYMDMTITNRAMQGMAGFAIQFNKNSFGASPGAQLNIPTPLLANSSAETSLPVNTGGAVQRMDPLNNLQVAIKNNVDIFYFSCQIPYNVLFAEDGQMDRKVFLATWKDIPATNEVQNQIGDAAYSSDVAQQKLSANNIFTIAKRTVEGQDMLYQSVKFTNNIWVLAELKMQPGNAVVQLSLKTRAMDVVMGVQAMYEIILHN
ncbi:AP-1 complex subunit beta-1 [Desmophyllum pertusum]|uniref:AP-1 complex subunit beta-1 n=1 Tax=Desmophyllum pertusum TaxID=174260 RepID=A0A9X0CS25_9CNID|nr:AP-1 complex subunit beta-1 [Desmophyllum pertusum]